MPTLSTKLPIIWNCFAYELYVQWALQLIQWEIRCGSPWMAIQFKYWFGKLEFPNCWYFQHDACLLCWHDILCVCDSCYFWSKPSTMCKDNVLNQQPRSMMNLMDDFLPRCDGCFKVNLPIMLAEIFMWTNLFSLDGYLKRLYIFNPKSFDPFKLGSSQFLIWIV
jgi:hypothetical protein